MIAKFFSFALVIAFAEAGAQITFNNYCGGPIEVTVSGDKYGPNQLCHLESRASCSQQQGGQLTFRNGYAAATTKAELKLDNADGNDYYDLSVIDGYDVPMQLINSCTGDTITCRAKDCPEAYLNSGDNTKTHGAKACGSYVVNFCA